VKARIKRNLVGGIVVVAPLAVTVFVVVWIYGKVSALPSAGVMRFTGVNVLDDLVQVAFSVFALFVILVLIGFVTRTAMGVFLKDEMDRILESIPVVRVVYKATKTGVETIAGGKGGLKKPVKVGFGGLRLTAFKTGGKTKGGREVVFLPTAPNITSGFVLEVDPDMLEDADETTEEALTRILSAGFGAGEEEMEELLEETVSDMEEVRKEKEETDTE
jgi:uncharacterized membrane protein